MRTTMFTTLALTLCLTISVASAADYGHGHGALQIFDAKGFEQTPLWVRIWVVFMMLSFVSGLLFVKNHTIARWVVGGMFAGMLVGTLSGSFFGITMLSGYIALIHLVFWSPALYQLLSKRPFLGSRSAFSIWSGVMTAVILFSFVFDIRDAYIYLQHII